MQKQIEEHIEKRKSKKTKKKSVKDSSVSFGGFPMPWQPSERGERGIPMRISELSCYNFPLKPEFSKSRRWEKGSKLSGEYYELLDGE